MLAMSIENTEEELVLPATIRVANHTSILIRLLNQPSHLLVGPQSRLKVNGSSAKWSLEHLV